MDKKISKRLRLRTFSKRLYTLGSLSRGTTILGLGYPKRFHEHFAPLQVCTDPKTQKCMPDGTLASVALTYKGYITARQTDRFVFVFVVVVSLIFKSGRLHVAMRLFSNRSQKTSKWGKNIVTHSAIASFATFF